MSDENNENDEENEDDEENNEFLDRISDYDDDNYFHSDSSLKSDWSDAESDSEYSESNSDLDSDSDSDSSSYINFELDDDDLELEGEEEKLKGEEILYNKNFKNSCKFGEYVYKALVEHCTGSIFALYTAVYMILDCFRNFDDFNITHYVEVLVDNNIDEIYLTFIEKKIIFEEEFSCYVQGSLRLDEKYKENKDLFTVKFIPTKNKENITLEEIKFNRYSKEEKEMLFDQVYPDKNLMNVYHNNDKLFCFEDLHDEDSNKLYSLFKALTDITVALLISDEYLGTSKITDYDFSNYYKFPYQKYILKSYEGRTYVAAILDKMDRLGYIKFLGSKLVFNYNLNNKKDYVNNKIICKRYKKILNDDNDDIIINGLEIRKKRKRNKKKPTLIRDLNRQLKELQKQYDEIPENTVDRKVYQWDKSTWTVYMLNNYFKGNDIDLMFSPEQRRDNYSESEIEEIDRKIERKKQKNFLYHRIRKLKTQIRKYENMIRDGKPLPRKPRGKNKKKKMKIENNEKTIKKKKKKKKKIKIVNTYNEFIKKDEEKDEEDEEDKEDENFGKLIKKEDIEELEKYKDVINIDINSNKDNYKKNSFVDKFFNNIFKKTILDFVKKDNNIKEEQIVKKDDNTNEEQIVKKNDNILENQIEFNILDDIYINRDDNILNKNNLEESIFDINNIELDPIISRDILSDNEISFSVIINNKKKKKKKKKSTVIIEEIPDNYIVTDEDDEERRRIDEEYKNNAGEIPKKK
jgi:hypothetical protein